MADEQDNVTPMPITSSRQLAMRWESVEIDFEAMEKQLADTPAAKRLTEYLEAQARRHIWPAPRLVK